MSATTPEASTTTSRVVIPPPEDRRGGMATDTWIIVRRSLIHIKRVPENLTDATIQPVMFTLLFAFVFGGAIAVGADGTGYKEFIIGGIFAQTIAFAVFGVAMTIANDRTNGGVDRFRSLPMAPGSYLAGVAVANLIRTLIPLTFMSLAGLLVGWRIRNGFLDALGGYALMMIFAFAMIWIGVLLGATLPGAQAVQGVAFVVIFPITFIASTFVPADTLPPVLRTIAEWNPISTLAEAVRIQFGNPTTPVGPDSPWSMQNPALYTIIWAIGITIVVAPIAVRLFQRSTQD